MEMMKITEEPSKEQFLQSRVDQQVELICILKQRADGYLEKNLFLEEQSKTLHRKLEDSQSAYVAEEKKSALLKVNISNLEQQYQQLSNEQETLKIENALLKQNCSCLENTVMELKESLGQATKELEDIPGASRATIAKLEKEIRALQESSESYKEDIDKTLMKKEKDFNITKTGLLDKTKELKAFQKEYEELQKVNQVAMERKKSLEKQVTLMQHSLEANKADIEKLEKRLEREQKQFAHEKEKIKKEYEQRERELPAYAIEKGRQEMKQDLDAYKEHAQKLLNREQKLNAKLRRFNVKPISK